MECIHISCQWLVLGLRFRKAHDLPLIAITDPKAEQNLFSQPNPRGRRLHSRIETLLMAPFLGRGKNKTTMPPQCLSVFFIQSCVWKINDFLMQRTSEQKDIHDRATKGHLFFLLWGTGHLPVCPVLVCAVCMEGGLRPVWLRFSLTVQSVLTNHFYIWAELGGPERQGISSSSSRTLCRRLTPSDLEPRFQMFSQGHTVAKAPP